MFKTFHPLLAVLFSFLAFNASAQSVSRESLKRLFVASGNAEQFVNQSQERINQFVSYSQAADSSLSYGAALAKVQNYFMSDACDDLVDVVYPYFSSLSESDVASLLQLMSSNSFRNANYKIVSASLGIQSSSQQQMTSAFLQIYSGSEPSLPTMTSMPDSYMAVFDKYCSVVGMDESIDAALASTRQLLSASLGGTDKIDSIFDYIKQATKIYTFNAFAASVSQSDIQICIDVFSTEAGRHFADCSNKMSADLINVAVTFGQKILERLK